MEPHGEQLIATIAICLAAAFVGGFIARHLRLPSIVGYLVAGIAVGPFTPGPVADSDVALELAEIGVALLMFGVGLHFSIRDLVSVRRLAVPGALVQIAVATSLGVVVGGLLGWGIAAGFVIGLAVSVASTVVLLRVLTQNGVLHSDAGRVAVGWLIVEDLFTVLALVLLPVLATALDPGSSGAQVAEIASAIALAIGKAALLTAVMLLVGRRVLPWILEHVEGEGGRELFTLAVVAIGLGVAFGAATVFDVSIALGAFLAGAVVSESRVSARAATDILPLTDVFTILFFVSVGMLLDPAVLVNEPLEIVAILAVVIVGKSLAALAIVTVLRGSHSTAVTVAVALAQIGEFSFIVATSAANLDLLPPIGFQLIVAVSLISIALNPLLFSALRHWTAPPRSASFATSTRTDTR